MKAFYFKKLNWRNYFDAENQILFILVLKWSKFCFSIFLKTDSLMLI